MRRFKIGLSVSLMTATLVLFMSMSLLIGSVSAKFGPIGKSDSEKATSDNHEIDMLNDMLVGRTGSDVVFEQAKDIIKRLNHSPVCAHDATKRLLVTCKRTKTTSKDPESASILENAKTVYAIRHAICQVRSAKSAVPDVCLSIEHISEASAKTAEVLPNHQITVCLKALSQGHFWTSYSNSLQDASVLCDPARIDYKQEELLDNYHELTHQLPGLLEGVKRYVQSIFSYFDNIKFNLQDEMRKLSEEINMTMQLQLQTRSEFQDTAEKAQKFVVEMMYNHGQEISSMSNKTSDISDALATIPDEMQAMAFELFAMFSQIRNESLATMQNLANEIERVAGDGLQQIQEPMAILQRDLQIMQAQQTVFFQEQYNLALNLSNMNKLNYEVAAAMNENINIMQENIDTMNEIVNTMAPTLKDMAPILNVMAATLKGVLALGSSFGFLAFVLITGIALMAMFPRFKTIGVALVVVIIYKLFDFVRTPGWFTGIKVGINIGSWEFMLWVAAGFLVASGLLLAWIQKRCAAKASRDLPLTSSAFVIEGLEKVSVSNKQQSMIKAATVV